MSGAPLQLLAVSGSLRAGASNTALLEAAALVAPAGVTVVHYDRLAELPAFNPDLDTLEGDTLPAIVADLRARVGRAGGLLISAPEYAHGIPGAFKNLLDWLVGSIEFPGTPVAVLTASARSVHAPAQLREILTTMNARLVEAACITVPVPPGLDAAGIVADPVLSATLGAAVAVLAGVVRARDR
jgi:chromate reductase, NAD(P)H dehydrogenase (quinone)